VFTLDQILEALDYYKANKSKGKILIKPNWGFYIRVWLPYYNNYVYDVVNQDNTTSYFTMITTFDPFGALSIDFVSDCRNILDDLCTINNNIY